MSRYINTNGTLAVIGRGEGLTVVIANVWAEGAVILRGALADEDQTEAEYMAMHGFEPLGDPPVGYDVQFNVDRKHWLVELAEAMEEMVRSTDAHTKSAARLAKATAALTRAQINAENSILGTDA